MLFYGTNVENVPWHYLADPDYSGPGDALHSIDTAIRRNDPSHKGFTGSGLNPDRAAQLITVLQLITEWPTPIGGPMHVNTIGENSLVLELGTVGPIIKLTPPYKGTALEGLSLLELMQYRHPKWWRWRPKYRPPVQMPDFILYRPANVGMMQQLWQTRVGGVILSNEEIRTFSNTEKHHLGKKLGRTVMYLADALPLERYKEILEEAGNPELFDRAWYIKDITKIHGMDARHMNAGLQEFAGFNPANRIHPTLAKVIQWQQAEYKDLEESGRLQPTIIGHDDLRPNNLPFKGPKGKRELSGVIDFELIMPGTVERSLRHMAVHGEEVIGPAEEAYGKPLDRRALNLWAIGQLATVAAVYMLRLPETRGLLAALLPDLEFLVPEDVVPKKAWAALASAI